MYSHWVIVALLIICAHAAHKRKSAANNKNFTRMSSSAFEDLINKIGPRIQKIDTRMREAIPVQDRVVINVPQRTKHVHHHHVKKVPIYVLLPTNKKSRILEDLGDASKERECTKVMPAQMPKYTYPGQHDEQKNIHQWPIWKDRYVDNERNNYEFHKQTTSSNQNSLISLPFRRDSIESREVYDDKFQNLKDMVDLHHANNNKYMNIEHMLSSLPHHQSSHSTENLNITPIIHSKPLNDLFYNKSSRSPASSFQYNIQYGNNK